MRLAALLLLLTTACTSCSTRARPVIRAAKPWPSMTLIGRYGLAHACPVENYIVTAAHVAERIFTSGNVYPQSYVYQQGPRKGFVSLGWSSFYRDLAWLQVDSGPTPQYHLRPTRFPLENDAVYWYEFTYEKGLKIVQRKGHITSLIAGHWTFRPAPSPGASGGCLYTDGGKVIGVVTWSLPSGGVAPSVLGQFGPS